MCTPAPGDKAARMEASSVADSSPRNSGTAQGQARQAQARAPHAVFRRWWRRRCRLRRREDGHRVDRVHVRPPSLFSSSLSAPSSRAAPSCSGFPSVGKSSLMSGLTGTESIAAAYEFSASSLSLLPLPLEPAQDSKLTLYTCSDPHHRSWNAPDPRRADPDPRPARNYRGRQGRQGTWSASHCWCVLLLSPLP